VIYPSASGNYSLSFTNRDMPYEMNIYLIDHFTSSMVNITSVYKYSYSTTSDASSRATNRFMVIFADNVSSLPVVLSQFAAEKTQNNTVSLSWSTSSEMNNNYFEVQRSTIDQNSYVTIGEVAGKGNSIVSNTYSLLDDAPSLSTTNYYRLKQVDFNNKYTYSPIVAVDFYNNAKENTIETSIHVFPVPANDILNIALTNSYKGDITLNIYTIFGDLVKTSNRNFTSKISQTTQDLSNLNSGVYLLEVVSKDGSFKEQTKFIKE
jgi:Secretion system C-terminal sorting domain